MALRCAFTTLLYSPERCLGELIVVARDLNIPWLNYLTGITLFKAGQFEGAQRFLNYSLNSPSLALRARYFHTLAKASANARISDASFEEAVLAGLDNPVAGWYPVFVKRIEKSLLDKYARQKTDETYEGMAFALISHLYGGSP